MRIHLLQYQSNSFDSERVTASQKFNGKCSKQIGLIFVETLNHMLLFNSFYRVGEKFITRFTAVLYALVHRRSDYILLLHCIAVILNKSNLAATLALLIKIIFIPLVIQHLFFSFLPMFNISNTIVQFCFF